LLTQLIAAGERNGAEARTLAPAPAGRTVLAELARPPVTGGGVPVGEIRAVLPEVSLNNM
jgi:hypothetical protein